MSTFTKRVGAAAAATQTTQWVATGGLAGVLSGTAVVMLRVFDVFTWWLALWFAISAVLIAYVLIAALVTSSRELRIVLPHQPGRIDFVEHKTNPHWSIVASMVVTNLSERSNRFVKVRMKSGPKLVGNVNVAGDTYERRLDAEEKTGWISDDELNVIGPDDTLDVSCSFTQLGRLPVDKVECKSRLVLTDRFGREHTTRKIDFGKR